MASCTIKINGQVHAASSSVLDYVNETTDRNFEGVLDALSKVVDVTVRRVDGKTIGVGDMSKIGEDLDLVNRAATNLYNASGRLFVTENIRATGIISEENINSEVLNELKYIPKPVEEVEDQEVERFSATFASDENVTVPRKNKNSKKERNKRIAKVFGTTERSVTIVENMIVNLEKEINRLSRQEETEKSKSDILILNNLKNKLRNSKTTLELAQAYSDFVYYVENTAKTAKAKMARIKDNYSRDYESLSESERLTYLQEIFELKQQIDAFYSHESEETSLLNLMQIYANEIEVDVEVKVTLIDAIQIMSVINKRYLDIGIPIQADYLMQFVPDERINSQLKNRIEDIKKNKRINGLRRKDPRYLSLYSKYLPLSKEFRDAVLELNIKQLEEQIVGRDSIIKELRVAHRDPGFISTYMDPLVYSSEVSMQAFARSLKNKLYEAHDKTIETKYNLKNPYYKFRDWKGGSENDVAKLNEDLIEEVTIFIYDSETDSYIPKKVLSLVQKYNITKYYTNKNQAFKSFKEQYEYPKNATKEDIEDYFENNPKAVLYNEAVDAWWEANSDPIEGARDTIRNLEVELKSLLNQRYKLQNKKKLTNKDLLKIDRLTHEIAGVNNELKQVSRNGTPIGRLTKPKLSLYSNPKYKAMPVEAKEYYDYLLDIYKKDQKKIGRNSLPKNSWENFSHILPSIRKSSYDSLKENGLKSSASNMFGDAFTFQETDTDFGATLDANGEPLKSIPQYYTNIVDSNLVSKDVTASIIKFNDMANRYKAKADISGVVNIMRTAVANRQRIELNHKGEPVLDSVAKKLGIDKIANFNANNQDSNALKQLESFIDNVYFGISDKDQSKNAIAVKFSKTKLANVMSTLTAVTTLSGSYMQAINQMVVDSVQGGQEAWAGQFYNNKDLWWAKEKLYNVFNGNLLASGYDKTRQKFATDNKLNKFLEMMDAFQSFGRDVGGETGSTLKKSWSLDSMFMFQNAAEYMTTAERALALAHSYEGKLKDSAGNVIKNNNGEDANLWDVLITMDNGKLIVDPKVANFKASEFQILLHGILKRTNQLKGDFDKPLANRYAVGRLLTLFRSYFMPGWRKRFGHSAGGTHIDVELGQVTEGYYQTFANNFGNALYDFRNLEIAAGVKKIFSVGEDSLSKQNRARLLHELITIQMAAIMAYAVSMVGDDDDEEGNLSGMIMYQMLRLRTELTSFRSPTEFFRIAQSPTAAATPIKQWSKFITSTLALGQHAIGLPINEEEIYYQKKSGIYEKGDLKWWKNFASVFPGAAGFIKSGDPNEALKFYE